MDRLANGARPLIFGDTVSGGDVRRRAKGAQVAADPWPIIHAERGDLARDLSGLSAAQWHAQSLCGLWTVRDVVAHLTATAKMTTTRFLRHLAASGLRYNAMTARDVLRETTDTTAEQLAEFRAHGRDTTHPPGSVDAMLGEIILHAEDIRRPLRIKHVYPRRAVMRIADFYSGSSRSLGSKRRIAGLRLRATDADWTHGSGVEVTGPILALALAMTGREAGLSELSGEGIDTLRSRL